MNKDQLPLSAAVISCHSVSLTIDVLTSIYNQALNPRSVQMPQSDAFSDLDLDGSEQVSDPSLTSFADDGTNAGLNYDQGDAVTSFSADRAEQASDAEWSSLEQGDSSRVMKMKVLSNVLERDAPLDFSLLSSNSTADSRTKASAPVPTINFTPLGDLPATPAVPTNIAEAFAAAQFQKARNLFSIGMTVDPQHGPLYHAYGNMELVNMHACMPTLAK